MERDRLLRRALVRTIQHRLCGARRRRRLAKKHRVYVQAVLPAATRTEIWERAGHDVNTLPAVMEVGELVDAALAGFDRRELVTIPPLHDVAQWEAFQAARQVMLPFQQAHPAERYRTAA